MGEVVSVKVDEKTKRLMKMHDEINWSAVVRRSIERKLEEADSKKIMLDFNKVEFVSRSATHALIKLKEKYNKSWNIFNKKKIVFININRSFEKMVQSVVASKKFMNRKVEFNPEMVSADALFDKNIV